MQLELKDVTGALHTVEYPVFETMSETDAYQTFLAHFKTAGYFICEDGSAVYCSGIISVRRTNHGT